MEKVKKEDFDTNNLSVFDCRRSLPKISLVPQEITAAAHHITKFTSESNGVLDELNQKMVKLLLRLGRVIEVFYDEADQEGRNKG